jgi:hypothetical protein
LVRESVLQKVLTIAREIVREEVSPYKGAAAIWSVLAEEEGEYPEDFRVFVGLASEWQDQPDHREAYEKDILEEAQLLLERHGSSDRS